MSADSRPGLTRFLILYALANAGGVVAYLPLLTLLLPLKIEGMAPDTRIGLLTITAMAGAISASISNITFGTLSDRTLARGGARRGWIAAGLVATTIGYAGIWMATTPIAILLAMVVWQAALNMVLAPLAAMMADRIPNDRKGVAGGLLALASPLASLSSALLFATIIPSESTRYAIICVMVVLLVLPVLIARPPPMIVEPVSRATTGARDLMLAWTARLAIQVAGVVLFGYALFYFEGIAPSAASTDIAPGVGHIMTVAFALALPIALVAGRLSDRARRRKPFLLVAAVVAAAGLAAMAVAGDWTVAAMGFAAYTTGSAVFLALHSALALQLLPSPVHRGRDLGLLNLTNTVPALLGPGLTWLLATPGDFGVVLVLLAVLTLSAGLMTQAIRDPNGNASSPTFG